MRRFIDVVFVNPKSRYYVILHQGKFWQLARMSLTASSWVFKLLYKGNLADIYVARNQAITDEKLAKTLKTYNLPQELHGLNAQRFLDWWETNDYKWLATQDAIDLDDLPVVAPKPIAPPKTVIMPGALDILKTKKLTDISKTTSNTQTLPTSQSPTPHLSNQSATNHSSDAVMSKFHTKSMPISTTNFTPDPNVPPNPIPNPTPINLDTPNPPTPPSFDNFLDDDMNGQKSRFEKNAISKLHEFNAQYAKKPMPIQSSVAPPAAVLQPSAALNTKTAPNAPKSGGSATQTQPKSPVNSVKPDMSTSPPQPRQSVLDESFDIFDSLLKELTDELIH